MTKNESYLTLEFDESKSRLSRVDKEIFEIKFSTKESTIENVQERCIVLQNDLDERENKIKNLNTELENEHKRAKEMFDENFTIIRNLNEEIEELIKEKQLNDEIYYNELKEADDVFIQKTKEIKTSWTIYSGKLNNYIEMSKQMESLEQKHQLMINQIDSMKREYDTQLITLEKDYWNHKKAMKASMLKLCTDFTMQLKLLEISNENISIQDSCRTISGLKDMLKTIKEQNFVIKENLTNAIKDNNNMKSIKLIHKELYDTYSKKKIRLLELQKEVTELEDVIDLEDDYIMDKCELSMEE